LVFVITAGILLENLPTASIIHPTVGYRLFQMQLREPDSELLMPVEGVPVKRVANTWGAPRSGGRDHQGQDIFAKRGTPVVSATNGIVVRIGTNSLGGQIVSVMGNGGRMYYYAHLDGYAPGLVTGQTVAAGDLLGYVGTTGNARSTPPHLHFGVYTATGPINPLPMLVNRTEPKDRPPTTAEPARSRAFPPRPWAGLLSQIFQGRCVFSPVAFSSANT
jgi:murein DD-endopeptidase MepM/ murein hydrolase activator NlpD